MEGWGPRDSVKWWAAILVHNWVAHPLLPLAEVLDVIPSRRTKKVAAVLFEFHDMTFPEGAG